jgi:acetyl-CoA carboxylase biotin carboxyl carrier protein
VSGIDPLGEEMVEIDDWVSTLRGIIAQMAASDVKELELQRGDLRVRLRRQPAMTVSTSTAAGDIPVAQNFDGAHRVTAPLTGVFYAAPGPNARAYVQIGDWVQPETLVGLIETMKVFNEVVADCQGRVVAIMPEQGQLIHSGETIILVDTNSTPDEASRAVS